MADDHVATAAVLIDAPSAEVWEALVTPSAIKEYMFGADVSSTWEQGERIVWKGEWQGKPYEDKGTILEVSPSRLPRYSHFSPLSGLPDVPANYHTVTIELREEGPRTRVVLTEDNNPTVEARAHSEKNWATMLAGLKEFVEG